MSFNTLSTLQSNYFKSLERIIPSPTQFATFTNITGVSSFTSVKSLSTSGYNNAVVVTDYARKKMLVVICNATSSYVAYSNFVGGSWSAITTLIAAGGGQLFPGVVLSGDGTKGLIIGTTNTYSIDWSSTNPTSSTIESTSTHGYNSCCILPDGLKVLLGCYPTGLYYTTWNSGTSKFNTAVVQDQLVLTSDLASTQIYQLFYSIILQTVGIYHGLILIIQQTPFLVSQATDFKKEKEALHWLVADHLEHRQISYYRVQRHLENQTLSHMQHLMRPQKQ